MPNKKRKSEASLINNTANDDNNNNNYDDDDDLLQVVNAPTPANRFIERQVEMLLQEDSVITILDTFIKMELHKEENYSLCDAFKNTNICKNIISVIETQDQTDEVVRKACGFITRLTCKDKEFFTNQLATSDSIQAITDQMKIFLENEELQVHVCEAISSISCADFEENSIMEIFKNDTLKVISDVMKKYPENVGIQGSIAILVYNVSLECKAMRDIFIQNNFVEYTLDALNKNFEDNDLSKYFCEFLKLIVEKEEVKICIRAKDGTILLAKIESH
eukprot:CAMPEP_0194194826 /NCGR_PEP_ID=MMETSP0154-20130528/75796_1 /TAXON_ID=1049557 /ORGANISM="Thalassiothrix antarctica, Strain L6-D1" /LENGTH=276 /DNA_ID=CAMNT_0038919291 /DNA_START=168 /DNA_END=995 /DNA_ORIENTATION=+